MKKSLLGVASLFLVLAAHGTAWAGTVCPNSIKDKVMPNIGCEIGSTQNDFISSPLQVNMDVMFSFSDWVYAEKFFETDEAFDIGLSLSGDTISGTWMISDVWGTDLGGNLGGPISDIMLVFNDGNATPATYVGYLLPFGTTSGDYMTPFSNGNPKDISHVSAYVRSGTTSVPEPATLLLLGSGLLVGGVFRKRIK